MSDGHVHFDQVWMKFERGELHDSLRDLLPALAGRLTGRRPKPEDLGKREFWAVRDVSFEVRPGEALGIIGPNGAGKSTILKLLTKILRPTRGRCQIRGRVGALIEIAAGFHPDLTGRENVYLQGAIMGMRRAEIAASFDEIVEFSGLPEFIDTPVKRYSSGMNARLGFSIAVHLNPDVLIVDEVLAVGDHSFQQKAFGRIGELAKRDIPVVIVSHQLDKIAALCSHALLLDRGSIVRRGTPEECIAQYISAVGGGGNAAEAADHPVQLESLERRNESQVRSGDHVGLVLRGHRKGTGPVREELAVLVRSLQTNQTVFARHVPREELDLAEWGPFALSVDLQANVGDGLYSVETFLWDPVERRGLGFGPQVVFQVDGNSFFGTVNMHAQFQLLDTRVPAERAAS